MGVMSRNSSRRREGSDVDDNNDALRMKQKQKQRQRQRQGAKLMIMSKDIATHNPSFRVYYGGAPRSVPFTWESAPGTPKHNLFSSSGDSSNLPPLTPPPSFYSASNDGDSSHQYRSSAALKLPKLLFRALFPKTTSSSSQYSASSDYHHYKSNNGSLWYSSSTSSSSGTTPAADVVYRPKKSSWRIRCFSCSRLAVHHQGIIGDELEEEEEEGKGANVSINEPRSVCLGGRYSFGRMMRNAFFSVGATRSSTGSW